MTSPSRRLRYLVWPWLILLVTLTRLPALYLPFDNDSAANAYHARLISEGEPLYGTHHPGHHLPAVYYIYSFAGLLFGEGSRAVKLFLIPWTILTAYFVYRIGKQLASPATGPLAATFFSLMTSHVSLKGTTAEIELFANLPLAAAVFFSIELIARDKNTSRFAIIGFLGAIALLFKAVYIAPLLIVLLLMYESYPRSGFWQKNAHRLLCISAGFLAVILPVLAYFSSKGLTTRFLEVFKFGSEYAGDLGLIETVIAMLFAPLYVLSINNLPMLVCGIAQIIAIFHRRWKFNWSAQSLPRSDGIVGSCSHSSSAELGVALYLIFAYAAAGIGRPGFVHYNLVIVPPLSLLAAYSITLIWRKTASPPSYRRYWVGGILVALIISATLFSNRRLYYHYLRYAWGQESYNSYLQNSSLEGRSYLEAKRLADYLIPRCSVGDNIYLWSDNMELYDLVPFRVPVENPWPYYADRFGPPARIFAPKTAYIILGETILRPRPEWLYQGLSSSYRMVAIIGGYEIYQRIKQE